MAVKPSLDNDESQIVQVESESTICFSQYSNVTVYGKPEMRELTNWIGAEVSPDWYLIGIQLKLSPSQLEEIKANCSTQAGKTSMHMFCEVMKVWENVAPQTGLLFNWKTILDALASPCVGRVQLALEVAKKIHVCQLPPQNSLDEDPDNFSPSNRHYTNDDLKKFCKCGKCSGDDIITKGCNKNAMRFPILDLKKLDPCKRRQYLYKLEQESEEMNDSFAALSDNICESLIAKKIPVKRVINYVLRLRCLKPSGAVCDLQTKIEDAQDMYDVFFVLNKISSWFNHQPLGKLMSFFELKESEKAYKKFTEIDIISYLQRSVTEIPKDAFGFEINGSGEFRLKLIHPIGPKALKELTGNQLYYIKDCVVRNFGIDIEHLHLFCIDEGCLELKFNIPLAIYEALFFPFSEEHSQGLGEILIKGHEVGFYLSSIWYEGCYHDIPSHSKKLISSSLNPLDVCDDSHLTVVEKMTYTADNDLEKASLPECSEKASRPFNLQKKTKVPHFHVVTIIAHLQSITKAAEVAMMKLQMLFSEAQPFLSALSECKDFKNFEEMKELDANFGKFLRAVIRYLQSVSTIFDKAENSYRVVKDMTQATLCEFNEEMQEAIKATVCSYKALEEAIETLNCYHIAQSKDLEESKHEETDSIFTNFNKPKRVRFPIIKGEEPFLKVIHIFSRLESTVFIDTQNIIAKNSIEEKFTKLQILCNFSKAYECATHLCHKTVQTFREGFSEDQIKLILHTIIITPK